MCVCWAHRDRCTLSFKGIKVTEVCMVEWSSIRAARCEDSGKRGCASLCSKISVHSSKGTTLAVLGKNLCLSLFHAWLIVPCSIIILKIKSARSLRSHTCLARKGLPLRGTVARQGWAYPRFKQQPALSDVILSVSSQQGRVWWGTWALK